MNVGVMRLGFAVFWLVVAGVLYFRRDLALDVGGNARSLDLGALLALALALWNLVRWYIGRRQQPARSDLTPRHKPLEPGRSEKQGEEYNPEFDFNRPPQ